MDYDEWITEFHDLDVLADRLERLEAQQEGQR